MRLKALVEKKAGPIHVFISYAHTDEKYRLELEKHLCIFIRANFLIIWHDRKITPGQNWKNEISQQLDRADLILLLVSADFIHSDYCWNIEMKQALEKYYSGDSILVPILVRSFAGWEKLPLSEIQALPADAKPISSWRNKDQAYQNVVSGLMKLLEKFPPQPVLKFKWKLLIDKDYQEVDNDFIHQATNRLRKLTRDATLTFLTIEPGSCSLFYQSTEKAFQILDQLHNAGDLSKQLQIAIISIDKQVGATIRILKTDDFTQAPIIQASNLHEIILPDEVESAPFITELHWDLQKAQFPGLIFGFDPNYQSQITSEQISRMQQRVRNYMNTFLAIEGGNFHVNLNPYDRNCGIPEILRKTELGRDMLAQDLELKKLTAELLHPTSGISREFWQETTRIGLLESDMLTCFRVWIQPGKLNIEEKFENNIAIVKLIKMQNEVKSELEIVPGAQIKQQHQQVFSIFKKYIFPAIEKEVCYGHRFNLIRQILSTLVFTIWMKKQLIGKLDWINSNDPDRFKLNTVTDEPKLIKENYLRLFNSGIWTFKIPIININESFASHKFVTVGEIKF